MKPLTDHFEDRLPAVYGLDKAETEAILGELRDSLKAKQSEQKSFEDFAPAAELMATIEEKHKMARQVIPDDDMEEYLKHERGQKISGWASGVVKELITKITKQHSDAARALLEEGYKEYFKKQRKGKISNLVNHVLKWRPDKPDTRRQNQSES